MRQQLRVDVQVPGAKHAMIRSRDVGPWMGERERTHPFAPRPSHRDITESDERAAHRELTESRERALQPRPAIAAADAQARAPPQPQLGRQPTQTAQDSTQCSSVMLPDSAAGARDRKRDARPCHQARSTKGRAASAPGSVVLGMAPVELVFRTGQESCLNCTPTASCLLPGSGEPTRHRRGRPALRAYAAFLASSTSPPPLEPSRAASDAQDASYATGTPTPQAQRVPWTESEVLGRHVLGRRFRNLSRLRAHAQDSPRWSCPSLDQPSMSQQLQCRKQRCAQAGRRARPRQRGGLPDSDGDRSSASSPARLLAHMHAGGAADALRTQWLRELATPDSPTFDRFSTQLRQLRRLYDEALQRAALLNGLGHGGLLDRGALAPLRSASRALEPAMAAVDDILSMDAACADRSAEASADREEMTYRALRVESEARLSSLHGTVFWSRNARAFDRAIRARAQTAAAAATKRAETLATIKRVEQAGVYHRANKCDTAPDQCLPLTWILPTA